MNKYERVASVTVIFKDSDGVTLSSATETDIGPPYWDGPDIDTYNNGVGALKRAHAGLDPLTPEIIAERKMRSREKVHAEAVSMQEESRERWEKVIGVVTTRASDGQD